MNYDISLYSLMQFKIYTSLKMGQCDKFNFYNEGVEYSIKTSTDEEWIPLLYLYHNQSDGTFPSEIRGYTTFIKQEIQNDTTSIHLEVCNLTLTDTVQFRWHQFAGYTLNSNRLKDMWALDDICITLLTEDNEKYCIIRDSFDNLTRR